MNNPPKVLLLVVFLVAILAGVSEYFMIKPASAHMPLCDGKPTATICKGWDAKTTFYKGGGAILELTGSGDIILTGKIIGHDDELGLAVQAQAGYAPYPFVIVSSTPMVPIQWSCDLSYYEYDYWDGAYPDNPNRVVTSSTPIPDSHWYHPELYITKKYVTVFGVKTLTTAGYKHCVVQK